MLNRESLMRTDHHRESEFQGVRKNAEGASEGMYKELKSDRNASQSPSNKRKKHQAHDESLNHDFMSEEDLINNVLTHIAFVTTLVENTKVILQEYKKEVDLTRHEMNLMKHKIMTSNEETKNVLVPSFETVKRNLQTGIKQQEKENFSFEKQLSQLRKDRFEIEDGLILCSAKLTELEDTVGSYKLKERFFKDGKD